MKTLIVKSNRVTAVFLAGETLRINEGTPVTVADNFVVSVGDTYTLAEPPVTTPSTTVVPDPSRIVVVSATAPVNADGRPDGTIYIQTA